MLCLITNRRLCREPLCERVKRVVSCGVPYIILREKDLSQDQLLPLAENLKKITDCYGAKLIINSDIQVAAQVEAFGLQLPFPLFLKNRNHPTLKQFSVGVSVHSLEEALFAEEIGADRLLLGHIFSTACKKGMPPKGIPFLHSVKQAALLPLWAVGGILPQNIRQVRMAGAEVCCIMSTLLQSENPERTIREYQPGIEL